MAEPKFCVGCGAAMGDGCSCDDQLIDDVIAGNAPGFCEFCGNQTDDCECDDG